ncbi:Imm32 family immunity protein [Phaeacidiphilus oryzae]|uniref:Imm32 family immunity protein n=1 Tax=Phaeacidiphilus oryzae TaxID=348818 RepID=UPI001378813E|nr:hypothetical protein [Phaeacidiphilus oryzae]
MSAPRIKVYGSGQEITVTADAPGLRLLGELLMDLASTGHDGGHHVHFEPGINGFLTTV